MQQQQVQQERYTTASTLKCKFCGTIYFFCIDYLHTGYCWLSLYQLWGPFLLCFVHFLLTYYTISRPQVLSQSTLPLPLWQFGILLSLLWSIVPYPTHFTLCFGTLSRLQVQFHCGYMLLEIASPTFLFCPLPLVSLHSTKASNISLPCFIPALSKVLPALSTGFCVWSLLYHVTTSYYYCPFGTQDTKSIPKAPWWPVPHL